MTAFNVGDRVKFVDWHPDLDGTLGTVVEHFGPEDVKDTALDGRTDVYRVRADNDQYPELPAHITFAHEIELEPTP